MVHAFDLKGNQSASSMEKGGLQGLPLPGVTRRAGQRVLGVFRTIMYLTIYRKTRNGIVIDKIDGRAKRYQTPLPAGSDGHLPSHTNNILHAMCNFLTSMTIL